MAYCTQADLEQAIGETRLLQLANDTNTDTVDAALITWAILRASHLIDVEAGTRYAIPFSPVPPAITDLAVDLAICELADRREIPPEQMVTRRRRAQAVLCRLADGTYVVSLPSPATNTERVGARVVQDRTFTATTLRGF